MLTALGVANTVVCLAYMALHIALTRHLRKQHPELWKRFRFPDSSPIPSEAKEWQESLAQIGLSEYLRSGKWRALGDARLERLVRAQRLCFYAVCIMIFAALVVLIRPTPT